MMVVRDKTTSNRNPNIGLAGGNVSMKMVEGRGVTSNRNHAGRVGVAATCNKEMVEGAGFEPT